MSSKSIVTQLTNWYALSLFVIVLFASSYLYWTLSREMTAENTAVLRDRMETISELIRKGPEARSLLGERVRLEWPSRRAARVFVRILDERGGIAVESPDLPIELPRSVFRAVPVVPASVTKVSARTVRAEDGTPYLVYAQAIGDRRDDARGNTVYLALDLSRAESILSTYRLRLLAVLVVCLMLSVWLGRRWAALGFRPVADVVEVTRRIRSSTLNERVQEDELPVELKQLASTFNEMLDRLEEAFGRLTRFSSDIAHELRTPISNIRGEVEVALASARSSGEYREVLGSCLEECGRLSKVIDSLLFLAKAEQPQMQIRREAFDLSAEIQKVVEFYEASAAEDRVTISASVPEGLTLHAERTLLQRALTNLVSNAITYNREGGTILISAERNRDRIEIAVADTGEGISRSDLPLVFDRFYRADPARKATKLGGFGLGLTIVKTIVSLHQGEVRIESEQGTGTTVRMSFPDTV